MSDEPAAILATFSHFMRPVASRKVVPIVFEVPLEEFHKVIAALGTPDPANPVWCGIARVARKGKAGGAHDGALPSGIAGAVKSAVEPGASPPPATDSVTLVEGETGGAPRALTAAPPVSKSKRRWSEMPPSQRAALWTKEPDAWAYIREACGSVTVDDEVAADAWLKRWLEIKSKSDLDADPILANRFKLTEEKYQAWRQARGHGVI